MTVQKLINILNKIKDKSKNVIFCTLDDIEVVEESSKCVMIY